MKKRQTQNEQKKTLKEYLFEGGVANRYFFSEREITRAGVVFGGYTVKDIRPTGYDYDNIDLIVAPIGCEEGVDGSICLEKHLDDLEIFDYELEFVKQESEKRTLEKRIQESKRCGVDLETLDRWGREAREWAVKAKAESIKKYGPNYRGSPPGFDPDDERDYYFSLPRDS